MPPTCSAPGLGDQAPITGEMSKLGRAAGMACPAIARLRAERDQSLARIKHLFEVFDTEVTNYHRLVDAVMSAHYDQLATPRRRSGRW